ncbi:uncharacterized protein METZ01_LOCUS25965 [marine metagenome]|uniref:Uncharacterized protein n=1 Tax=marine metagenome TaxID=408172 RepID=A0A381Q198_9ZZZZ
MTCGNNPPDRCTKKYAKRSATFWAFISRVVTPEVLSGIDDGVNVPSCATVIITGVFPAR